MKTITVLTEDKPGVITRICGIFGDANINIETIDVDTHLNVGVISLTVSKNDHGKALELLLNAGLRAFSDDALLLKLEDKPGAVAAIAKRFSDRNINIKGMRIMNRDGKNSIVAIIFEKGNIAAELVKDVLIE